MIAAIEVQTAIVALLKNDTALMSLVKGIWEIPPVNTQYPFLTLGPHTESARPTFGRHTNGLLHFYIHVWWQSDNTEQGSIIVGHINDVLLNPTNYFETPLYNVNIVFEQANLLQSQAENIHHMPVRYLCYAYEKVT